jgi:flagellar basal body rod protein FlgC
MADASSISASGLAVSALGVAVSASNIANAATRGFVPARVDATAEPQGGVAGQAVPVSDPLAEVRADRAVLAPSRTDLATELLAQSAAARAYGANLASWRTSEETADALMKLVP